MTCLVKRSNCQTELFLSHGSAKFVDSCKYAVTSYLKLLYFWNGKSDFKTWYQFKAYKIFV